MKYIIVGQEEFKISNVFNSQIIEKFNKFSGQFNKKCKGLFKKDILKDLRLFFGFLIIFKKFIFDDFVRNKYIK